MDGRNLVHAAPMVPEPKLTPPTRLTISLSTTPERNLAATPESSTGEFSSRRSRVSAILLVVLAILLSVIVVTQVYRSRSTHAVQSPPPAVSAAPEYKPEPSPADLVSSASLAANTLSEQSRESPQESPRANVALTPFPARARLASSPVSAGAPGGHARSVILRLTNGAVINADEAWERKEGVWYRQAGMVTFLKRSRVSAIERFATPHLQQQTAVNNAAVRSGKSEDRIAQNQLRLRRLESVETKKPSRVKGFLKWTGRILKKPFKS
jgi:hypothetical protein